MSIDIDLKGGEGLGKEVGSVMSLIQRELTDG